MRCECIYTLRHPHVSERELIFLFYFSVSEKTFSTMEPSDLFTRVESLKAKLMELVEKLEEVLEHFDRYGGDVLLLLRFYMTTIHAGCCMSLTTILTHRSGCVSARDYSRRESAARGHGGRPRARH